MRARGTRRISDTKLAAMLARIEAGEEPQSGWAALALDLATDLIDARERLREIASRDPLCWPNEQDGKDPYEERGDSYVPSCDGCGHDHGESHGR